MLTVYRLNPSTAFCNLKKWPNDLCSFPRQTTQNHSNPCLCPNHSFEEAEVERFYDDLQDLLELKPKKDVLLIIWDWNARVQSQEIPAITQIFLGVQNEAGQRLTEFWHENAPVISNTLFQQHKRQLYTWTPPDAQYRHQIDYIFCSQRWRSSIQSAKTRLGPDCGSDHKILIAKFRLKLKKVEKALDHSGMT